MLKSFRIILKTYGLTVSIFFIFRLILFITESERVDYTQDSFFDVLHAFFIGIRFDVVISGYILFFPALVLIITELFNVQSKIVKTIFYYWAALFLSITFIICGADIPYFNHFFQRFSMGAFEWIDSPKFIFDMIIKEPKYFLIILPVIGVIFLFFKLLKKIFFKSYSEPKVKLPFKILFSLIFLALMFLGVRGRIEKKSPIRIGTAYFGNNSFLNQLGLNPVFTLLRSYLDSLDPDNDKINLMGDLESIEYVQEYLSIIDPHAESPIARLVESDTTKEIIKPNIVLIIMESMSAGKMTRHGDPNNLTPFLDSLSNQSLYFENAYTAGKHTYNGIFSAQFSFPALYSQHTMKVIKKYNGLSQVLKSKGYSTSFFIPHDSQFDNVDGFLRENDFENVISEADYPSDKVVSSLGVPDDYMFEYSIPVLNRYAKTKKPFFVSFMTASDHGPYFVPDYFKPHSTDIKKQTVEFADWSLRKFLYLAKEQEWFDNTIFVFIADHGAALNATYDISLDYHHSPLIFYAPNLLGNPEVQSKISGQIDIFPTLMGMLNEPYLNNTLGIDLMTEKRPYIIVNDDDKMGVLDEEFFLIMKKESESKLYKYKSKDRTNYAGQFPEKVLEMEMYIKSNLQVYQNMLNKNQQFIE